MKEFDTYIFDLDGTLLSTLNDLAASTNYALRWAGMPEHTIEEIRMFVGNGVKLLMERAIPNGINNPKFEETYAKFREHYLEHNLDTTSKDLILHISIDVDVNIYQALLNKSPLTLNLNSP